MTFRTLIRRSLRFHWRSHLGVVLGAAIGSAALIGALVVGDSVKGSLRERALTRLYQVDAAMEAGDRFFTRGLFDRMAQTNANRVKTTNAPILNWDRRAHVVNGGFDMIYLPASVSLADGNSRVNRIAVFGTDDGFFRISQPGVARKGSPVIYPLPVLERDETWLTSALAQQLNVRTGDVVTIRIPKRNAFPGENPLSPRNDQTVALRLKVRGILPPSIGDFSLHVSQSPALNAYVNHAQLGEAVGVGNRSNLLLARAAYRWRPLTITESFASDWKQWRSGSRVNPFRDFHWIRVAGDIGENALGAPVSSSETADETSSGLAQAWTLADAECDLVPAPASDSRLELRTSRIFLDPPITSAARSADPNAHPILTYLATLLRAGTNAAPYSMVTAAGAPWTPVDLRDDEIVVGQWLADDLRVKAGDEIAVSYFLPESGAKLEEATNTFRVRSIVPMEMPWADRTLMPDFPGIEKAESTSDWDAGFPLTYEIRKKDDDYWKERRGTPKAFITLAAGQRMWGNRFGDLTAIRFPIPTNAPSKNYEAELEKKILANLKPEELGLRFEPVREQALKAAAESQDFGGLFLGFSFFLIIAALLLMAMLFQFGLEQRATEIGTLLALGFTPKQVRNLFLREGLALAFIGGVIGAGGGIYFAKAMLHGLTTIWRDAVGATALNFHFTLQTLGIGIFASVVVSTITIWLSLRKFVKRSPRELLVGEIQAEGSKTQSPKSKVIALAAALLALGLIGWTLAKGDTANAGAFFGAGALMLIAGLSFVSAWLAQMEREAPAWRGEQKYAPLTMAALAVRGCSRRRKRSLATVAMLACGSFLIVSIGVFRLDANRDATKRDSGTGGFALIGETTMPVVQDLNSTAGRDFFALNEQDLKGVNIVPFRVRAGDEASCLNLNAAQRPRLLGVKPIMLEGRFAFAKGPSWSSLRLAMNQSLLTSSPTNEIEIPAIGDANSIQWAMHKKVGDTIDYVDERGQPFKVRIVGAVANSILQGQLIIDEAAFVKRFPGESGYRMFLVDAPSNAVSQVSATLSRAMQDVGLELTPAAQRLDQFNAVQNTYLGTFQVLGGLGLLLGSVGLGIVVLRNVLERRSELAVLMAVGFRKQQVKRLLLVENGALLVVGLVIGIVAAGIAVLPALLSPAAQFPVLSLAITLAAVLLNGALWTWAATRYAVRGDLLKALRNE